MKNHYIQSTIFILVLLVALPVWAVDISVNIGSIFGGESDSKAQAKSAPPDHAPAHGYRKKHQYRYYPSAEVYFDPVRSLYFFLSSSQWKVSATLPNPLKLRLGTSVSIEMDSDKPYSKHAEHKSKYPPGLAKKRAKSHKRTHQKGNKGKGNYVKGNYVKGNYVKGNK
jgi:hypothetical protein